jgi:hypothetical protein
MITFKVSDVELAKRPMATETSLKEVAEQLIKKPIEGFPLLDKQLIPVSLKHSFVGTVGLAFGLHYPLVLSPDMIWLLIAQGFAVHITKNAEKMREHFVSHGGKKTLIVSANHFIKGQNNAWETIFPQFKDQIANNLNTDIYNIIATEFSTTTPVEKAVFELTLMEAMSEYFEYEVDSICGIPEITLLGTVEDWQKIIDNTKKLAVYDLSWWTDALLPILNQFLETAKGNINLKFWQSIYNYKSMSGVSIISGWIVQFLPYIEIEIGGHNEKELQEVYQEYIIGEGYESVHRRIVEEDDNYILEYHICKNPSLFRNYQGEVGSWEEPHFNAKELLKGITSTPLIWKYLENTYQMELIAGFMGATQDKKTFAVKPEIAWVVCEK